MSLVGQFFLLFLLSLSPADDGKPRVAAFVFSQDHAALSTAEDLTLAVSGILARENDALAASYPEVSAALGFGGPDKSGPCLRVIECMISIKKQLGLKELFIGEIMPLPGQGVRLVLKRIGDSQTATIQKEGHFDAEHADLLGELRDLVKDLLKQPATVMEIRLKPGMKVYVDGRLRGEGSASFHVAPGIRVVEVKHQGKRVFLKNVECLVGKTCVVQPPERVATKSRDRAREPASTPNLVTKPVDQKPDGGRLPYLAMGVTGVGVALIAVGAYYGSEVQEVHDTFDRRCGPSLCDMTRKDATSLANDGTRSAELATAYLVSGGVLMTGGITLWLIDALRENPSLSSSQTSQLRVQPWRRGVFLQQSWQF